jgi:hypothetical protein
LRANYGISYFLYWNKYTTALGPNLPQDGFSQTLNPTSLDGGVTPAFYWDNPYPQSFPTFPNINPSLDNNSSITLVNVKDNRPPMIINVGAEVERQLPGKILLRLSYIGSIGHRMHAYHNLNQYPLEYLALGPLLNQPANSAAAQPAGINVSRL